MKTSWGINGKQRAISVGYILAEEGGGEFVNNTGHLY